MHPIDRRHFLRGLGALIALPTLESLIPASTAKAAQVAQGISGAPPLRSAFVYVPNGVNNAYWWPTGSGTNFTLGSSLKALEPFKSDIQIVSGLCHTKANPNGDGGGDHARASATFLTGAQARKTASDIRAGKSVDQYVADAIGGSYRLPSLELSCDSPRLTGTCDSGYGCAYVHNMSWQTESQPMPAERNPRFVFERLFGSGSTRESAESRAIRARHKRSILDFVSDDAKSLERELSRDDQGKLDEYLTSVREIERRVAAFENAANQPELLAMPTGIPGQYDNHMRLMADMLVVAFQTQSTPVATLLFAHESSGRTFPSLGITEGHHSLSHHEKRTEKLEQIRKIDEFYVTQFAYLVERLKSVKEGSGTLLDNSMIVFGSGIRDGDRHDHSDLPIILAGGARGALHPGQFVQLKQQTPMSNLFVSMMQLHGVQQDRIGDSTGALKLA